MSFVLDEIGIWRAQSLLSRAFAILGLCVTTGCVVPEPTYPDLSGLAVDGGGLIVLVHGSGDSPEDWPAAMSLTLTGALSDSSRWDVWTYDWREDAAQRLVAAELGLLHGAHLGEVIAEQDELVEVHLVGHSVGAFVVHGVEQHFGSLGEDAPLLQSTYLDPFAGRGDDWDYGQEHFGESAVFADAYVNRDDSAPSTNGSLDWAHNFDVTALRPEGLSGRDAHWWPTQFYMESDGAGEPGLGLTPEVAGVDLASLHDSWPRGAETVVP